MNSEISNFTAYGEKVASGISSKSLNEVRNSKNGVGPIIEVNNNDQQLKKTLGKCVKW